MREKILRRFAWFLVALGILLFLLLGWASESRAQGNAFPPDNGPYSSGQHYLLPQSAVPLITFASVSPTTQTGTTHYYYWIVTNDVTNSRSSIPAGPFVTSIGPAALSATASIRIQWTPYTMPVTYGQTTAAGATPFTSNSFTYDILETATPAVPTGACACAVATGLANASTTDTGTYGAYTVIIPGWPANYPAPGDLATFGAKGSVIDGGPAPTPPPSPDVVQLTDAGFMAAQAALPSTGGASGFGGGVIDARNCTNLTTGLNFGTFTQTKPLTIWLGPCAYTATQILVGVPVADPSFHMTGCGDSCSVIIFNDPTPTSLITQISTNSQFDLLFQDFTILPLSGATQDVFNFTPTGGGGSASLYEFTFQRLWIGGPFGFIGNGIVIDASAFSNSIASMDRIIIDDNKFDMVGGTVASEVSLIGAVQGVKITKNAFATINSFAVSGSGVSLTSASATSFPVGVAINSNDFFDALAVAIESDGATGTSITNNTLTVYGSVGRAGIQEQVGTGTVHSSVNITGNNFNVDAPSLLYVLKTTDASATANFSGNVITGTPTANFVGFTNNLIARNNTGNGLNLAEWEPTLFANLGTPANGSFVYCSDCALTNPCTGSGTGAQAERLNGAWSCAPLAVNGNPAVLAYSVTTQSVDVPLTGSVGAVTITHAVTMPSTGCPCRVQANWAQYMTTSGSLIVSEEWVSDATNNFAEAEWPIDANNGPSGTGAGFSPVTYANSAVVTFTLHVEVDGSSAIARAAPFHAFGLRNSRLELAVMASN